MEAGTALIARLERAPLPVPPGTTAYMTGEAWLCALVQSHLVRERGLPPGALRTMPYWRQRRESRVT